MTRRRFVIAADGLSSEDEEKLRDQIRQLGAWWHWIDNVWLLTTHDEAPTAKSIRDIKEKEVFLGINIPLFPTNNHFLPL